MRLENKPHVPHLGIWCLYVVHALEHSQERLFGNKQLPVTLRVRKLATPTELVDANGMHARDLADINHTERFRMVVQEPRWYSFGLWLQRFFFCLWLHVWWSDGICAVVALHDTVAYDLKDFDGRF